MKNYSHNDKINVQKENLEDYEMRKNKEKLKKEIKDSYESKLSKLRI